MSMTNIESMKQNGAVLWWPGQYAESGAYDDDGNKRGFLILPDGVTITPNGTFAVQKMKDGRNIWKFGSSISTYINLSNQNTWSIFDTDFTMCTWFKMDTTGKGMVFACKWINASAYWFFYYSSGGIINMLASGTQFSYQCPLSATVGSWYHVTVVRSGNSCLIYINGVSQSVTINTAWGTMSTIDAPVQIGYDSADNCGYGNIKDLMIFKGKALTQDQIAAIYKETYIY